MLDVSVFTVYNLIVGLVTGLGVLYFFLFKRTVVEYYQFLFVTIGGLMLFLIGGPIAELLVPMLVHWVHGIAALLVIFGLYDPLENDLRREAWAEMLLKDPVVAREPAEWMLPLDDAILRLFHGTDLVLTPSILAYNIDYSREEVNRRLVELEQRGFVEKVKRGKYRITALGLQYIEGPPPDGLIYRLRYLWESDSDL